MQRHENNDILESKNGKLLHLILQSSQNKN